MVDSLALMAMKDLDAPIERVWEAWRDPESIARWWAPDGFHSTVNEFDFREGGRFAVVMHEPGGRDYAMVYIFNRLVEKRQIVITNTGSVEFGLDPFQTVIDMEEIGGRTRVVLTSYFSSVEEKRRHVENFDTLEASRQLLRRLEEQAKGG